MPLRYIALNALSVSNFLVMTKKVFRRFERDTSADATAWAKERAISIENYCATQNPELWKETIDFTSKAKKESEETLSKLGVDLGGGGAYPLLYFLIRAKKPKVIVETGVAAGWSSLTILEGLRANDFGNLFSSDFPYFRLDNPERFIGILVPERLRERWHLDIRGDEITLPSIVRGVNSIDFFHYDSDKSTAGRKFAIELIERKLSKGATVIMDDIQDNLYFRNWVSARKLDFKVFEFEGKYVGLVENFR